LHISLDIRLACMLCFSMTHNTTTPLPDNPFRDDPFTDDGHLLSPTHPFRKLRGLCVTSIRLFLFRAPQARPFDRFHPGKHNHRFTPSPYRHVFIEGQPQYDLYIDTRAPAEPCPIWAFADVEALNLDFFRPTLYYWYLGAAPPGFSPPPGVLLMDPPSEVPSILPSPESRPEASTRDDEGPALALPASAPSEISDLESQIPPLPSSGICNLESAIAPALSPLHFTLGPSNTGEGSQLSPDSEAALLLQAFFSALRSFPAGWTEAPSPWDYFTRQNEADV
jgi:hypothetical protein